jgi:hypothetical protein
MRLSVGTACGANTGALLNRFDERFALSRRNCCAHSPAWCPAVVPNVIRHQSGEDARSMLTPRLFPIACIHDQPPNPAVPRAVRLTPSPSDPRLYVVKDIGTLRVTGWTWRAATAEAGGRSWQITRHGIWRPVTQAVDVAGVVVGEFSGCWLHHGAALRWSNRELALRIDRLRQDRYILMDDDRKLATIDGVGSDKRPLNVAIDDTADIDFGLLLFAIYIVRTLAHKRRATARDLSGDARHCSPQH